MQTYNLDNPSGTHGSARLKKDFPVPPTMQSLITRSVVQKLTGQPGGSYNINFRTYSRKAINLSLPDTVQQ